MDSFRVFAILVWSFIGIRSRSGHEKDLEKLSFIKIVFLAIVGLCLFVGLIFLAVNLSQTIL